MYCWQFFPKFDEEPASPEFKDLLYFANVPEYTYGPYDYGREVARGEHTYYNWEMT